MEEKVLEVLKEFNEEIIEYDGDNLFDAGIIDSLQAINMVTELEDELDIEIDARLVVEENFKNKEAIVAMVMKIVEG